jgi:hypothetical protein
MFKCKLNLIFRWIIFSFKCYTNIFSKLKKEEMEFQEESVKITKDIIDKALDILRNTISLICRSKTLKNFLKNRMNNV